jgi:hypothetical protein
MRNLIRFFVVLTIAVASGIGYFAFRPAQAQAVCAPQARGVVAWYPGDGTANDIARANHGTLQGQATYAAGTQGRHLV